MKKGLLCMLLFLICALTACGQSDSSAFGDVLVMNCTDAEVCSVRIDWDNETTVGMNADGTALGRYEYLTFELDAVPATVTACDINGEVLASCTITELTQGRWGVHLTCDSTGSYVMQAREVADPDPDSPFVAGTEQTWQGVVTELCMAQVRAVDFRWSFLVPSRASVGIEPETGEGNCFWESKYYAFPDHISLNDYVELESAIEKNSGLPVATNIVKLENRK